MTSQTSRFRPSSYLHDILHTIWSTSHRLFKWITSFTSQPKQFKVICFEGNIGAGKSTIIDNLVKLIGEEKVVVLKEPISLWQDFHGHNMLDLYYRFPRQFAFTLQTFVQTSLLHQYHQLLPRVGADKIILMERSMSSSKDFFIPIMKESGYIDEHQMHVSSYLCDVFSDLFPIDTVIYLRSEPKQCLERIKYRGRKEEVDRIDLEYVTHLHTLHEKWYPTSCATLVDTHNLNREDAVKHVYNVILEKKLV